jgi:excisionase family DNA binding protein
MMKTEQQKDFVTFDEAAAYLSVSRSQIYVLIKQKKLTPFKPQGKRVYFRKKHLDEFIQQGEVITMEKPKHERATKGIPPLSEGPNLEKLSPSVR